MPPVGRRAALLGAASTLAGCGWRPLYAPDAFGGTSPVGRELAAIYVPIIPERVGQLLRQALQQRVDGSGAGVAKQFELLASVSLNLEGVAVQRDSNVTRYRVIATSTWYLRKLDLAHTPVAQGYSRVVDGYNNINNQVFAAELDNDAAVRRITSGLADQIVQQVSVFLKRRAGGLA